jgi:hypothetical protein
VQVLLGQGMHPVGYHRIVDVIEHSDIESYFAELRHAIRELVDWMPERSKSVGKNCRAVAPVS